MWVHCTMDNTSRCADRRQYCREVFWSQNCLLAGYHEYPPRCIQLGGVHTGWERDHAIQNYFIGLKSSLEQRYRMVALRVSSHAALQSVQGQWFSPSHSRFSILPFRTMVCVNTEHTAFVTDSVQAVHFPSALAITAFNPIDWCHRVLRRSCTWVCIIHYFLQTRRLFTRQCVSSTFDKYG